MPNPWDALSEHFNAHKNLDEVDTDAADNILIAWPKIIEQINSCSEGNKGISILDYGCGTGTFCEKLYQLGYKNNIGMDSSKGMIEQANKNYGKDITFIHGSAENEVQVGPVNIITGIMVFQFVEDIEQTLKNLLRVLKPEGLFTFAVHNPETVKASLKRGKPIFSDFEAVENPKQGVLHLGTNAIPIYIRTAAEYDQIMASLGMKKLYEVYPPFTSDFLTKYGTDLPEDIPEYMILGYKKINF